MIFILFFLFFNYKVETIIPLDVNQNKKTANETHVVKSDGTTEKLKVNRVLTSQEESILFPLIQGLIQAGGGTISTDQLTKKPTKNEKINSGENTEKSKKQGKEDSRK